MLHVIKPNLAHEIPDGRFLPSRKSRCVAETIERRMNRFNEDVYRG